MPIEQGMAYATWSPTAQHWEMDLGNGKETRGTLNSIIAALSLEGWEIISVVPDQIKIQNSVLGATTHPTDHYVYRYALFFKRVASESGSSSLPS